jgi:hypothetical protein
MVRTFRPGSRHKEVPASKSAAHPAFRAAHPALRAAHSAASGAAVHTAVAAAPATRPAMHSPAAPHSASGQHDIIALDGNSGGKATRKTNGRRYD